MPIDAEGALRKVAAAWFADPDDYSKVWGQYTDPLEKDRVAAGYVDSNNRGWSWRTGLVDAGGAAVGGGLGYLLARKGGLRLPGRLLYSAAGAGVGYTGSLLGRKLLAKKLLKGYLDRNENPRGGAMRWLVTGNDSSGNNVFDN